MKQTVDFEQAKMLWSAGVDTASMLWYVDKNTCIQESHSDLHTKKNYAPTIGELIEWIESKVDYIRIDRFADSQFVVEGKNITQGKRKFHQDCYAEEIIDALVEMAIKIKEAE